MTVGQLEIHKETDEIKAHIIFKIKCGSFKYFSVKSKRLRELGLNASERVSAYAVARAFLYIHTTPESKEESAD